MPKATTTQAIIIALATLYFLNEGYLWSRWKILSDWQMRGVAVVWFVIVLTTVFWRDISSFLSL